MYALANQTFPEATSQPYIDYRLLRTEEDMCAHPDLYHQLCKNILRERGLLLAPPIAEKKLELIRNSGKTYRADGINLNAQHDQAHIIALDALLKNHGHDWINNEKLQTTQFGTQDALFGIIPFHDSIEDDQLLEPDLFDIIDIIIASMPEERQKIAVADAIQIVEGVSLLSRKDKNGERFNGDRGLQSSQWEKTPFIILIKPIDWCNKLATCVGVQKFEKNNQKGLKNALTETRCFFRDEQQGIIKHAKEKYPYIANHLTTLNATMAILYDILEAYTAIKSGELMMDPVNLNSLALDVHVEACKDYIESLPACSNFISPLIERLETEADKDPKIRSLLDNVILPSLARLNIPLGSKSIIQPLQVANSNNQRNP